MAALKNLYWPNIRLKKKLRKRCCRARNKCRLLTVVILFTAMLMLPIVHEDELLKLARRLCRLECEREELLSFEENEVCLCERLWCLLLW